MTIAYLGIGSNLGDRLGNLEAAVRGMAAMPGVNVAAVSSAYRTEPFGPVEQPDFLNAVVAMHTTLSPRDLLELAQHLEKQAHRKRHVRWGPRTLDVDILLYGEEVVDEPGLEVPHPGIAQRRFVLVPLLEVAPDVRLPDGTLPADLLAALPDDRSVTREPSMVIEW